MGWFFTKAALLTFGGAYAVLPYVTGCGRPLSLDHPESDDRTGWDWARHAGPLIMVVAFRRFVGVTSRRLLDPIGSFLPGRRRGRWRPGSPSCRPSCSSWRGPLVETRTNDLKFTAPLTASTAAVVGVILNLALFFGYHVLWPGGFGRPIRPHLGG